MVKNTGAWPWSSYRATAGEEKRPIFLNVSWLLSQFGKTETKAQAAYARFVQEGVDSQPWRLLNGPDVLGGDTFKSRLQEQVKELAGDIPKRKKLLRHLPLEEIVRPGRDPGDWMRETYREHGYRMQAIANYAKLHHSTVSKIIKAGDGNPRIKT